MNSVTGPNEFEYEGLYNPEGQIQDGTEIGLTLDDIGLYTDTGVFIPDAGPSSTTDPLNSDSDKDGISDGEEDVNYTAGWMKTRAIPTENR